MSECEVCKKECKHRLCSEHGLILMGYIADGYSGDVVIDLMKEYLGKKQSD